jgi:3-deoxy-D-manno-octulosonic-acid transferase
MHPILGWPYAGAAAAADLLARAPLPGDSKLVRTLRARRGLLASYEAWGREHRAADRPLLWVHAPSVGEGLQARPVIQLLRARHQRLQVAYTYFSPSAERFAATVGADFTAYLPFDRRRNAQRALDALRPTAIVFSKLDLWPALTAEAHARGIPAGMISATMSEASGRQGTLARALLRAAYGTLDTVGAVDRTDAGRLTALGVRSDRVTVTGDTRYDQVAAGAAAVDRESSLLAPLASRRPTLVAGSTWPADEHVLLAAWLELRRSVPDARLIIAPHEPTPKHLGPIRRWAHASALTLALLGDDTAGHADVILVDRVGVLGDLYALADAAYVGGGFHAAGLHSVLEPAAFGVPVVFGPRHQNSRDASLLIECDGGESVADAPTLTRALRIVLTEPDTRRGASDAARALIGAGLGAAEKSVDLIERLLAPRAGAR